MDTHDFIEEDGTSDALTPKQERFCLEYITDLNGTKAVIRAGYSDHPESAQVQASRLLSNAKVSDRIAGLKAEQAKRLEISADTVLRELLSLATVDVTDAFDDMGKLKPIKEIPEQVRRSMSSLEVCELFEGEGAQRYAAGLVSKPRFYDKTKALELLGKHLKLFADRVELTGKDGRAIETKNLSELPDDQVEARFAALMAKAKAANDQG